VKIQHPFSLLLRWGVVLLLAALCGLAGCQGKKEPGEVAPTPPEPPPAVTVEHRQEDRAQVFCLENGRIGCAVRIDEGKLLAETVEIPAAWARQHGTEPIALETDAGFSLEVMWTGWRAPGKIGNADNPLLLCNRNFLLTGHDRGELSSGVQELILDFSGEDNPFQLRVTYRLEPGDFFLRRRIAIRDTVTGRHFLERISPRDGQIETTLSLVKRGGFGQPAACRIGSGGAFFGLEYPASQNSLREAPAGGTDLSCSQLMGERIGAGWQASEWAVTALVPDSCLRLWFERYLASLRVAPLRPYLLYNSWYDLRAPEMVDNPVNVMNVANVERILDSFRRNLTAKHGITLDAFVLDDGWDVYRSDWVLRREQFPGGLQPVAARLQQHGTDLGVWFGPIGGYSHRAWRIGWMREHGYETVGDQLCVAGRHYGRLLKQRVVDLVRDDGVGYYKWDGIQFSCSEPDHGHPVGRHSRRAVMEAVGEMCRAVREENPDIFLNITSGTWLSPWWLKYADTIWMQGYDYGYADVPSLSKRDAAITYRDFVLYDDLVTKDRWFPIANLMTHGIIKGDLQKLGGEAEPLDKFTDNALLYFARGVAMWELYVSPDLLTDGEWNAIAGSLKWARDRFDILSTTRMIGGDPGDRQAYGYAHFTGQRGVVAVRNPIMERLTVRVPFAAELGLDPEATSLVCERVYPTRWISPELQSAGSELVLALDGYETAVYEIYPLTEATEPLLAGVTFEVARRTDDELTLHCLDAAVEARLLNPELVSRVWVGEGAARLACEPGERFLPVQPLTGPVGNASVGLPSETELPVLDIEFDLEPGAAEATLALLLEPSEWGGTGAETEAAGESEAAAPWHLPAVTAVLNGKPTPVQSHVQKDRWGWYRIPVGPDVQVPGPTGPRSLPHNCRVTLAPGTEADAGPWAGVVQVWLVLRQEPAPVEVTFELASGAASLAEAAARPMPPRPWPTGQVRRNVKLGTLEVR